MPSKKSTKVDILFCGLMREHDLFKKSLKDIKNLQKRKIVDNIIFSTWKGELQKFPDMLALCKKNKVTIIESEEPKPRGPGSIWCQMKSIDAGLKKVKAGRFVLRTRSDVYINPTFLESLFTKKETLLKITEKLPKGNIFKHKVWVPWYELTRPFYMADECFFGHKDDIQKLVNYETAYDTDYEIGGGLAHIRRFIDPFIKQYPILKTSLGAHNPQKASNAFVRSFSKKFFNLYKFGFLRKLGAYKRFKNLKLQLKQEEYQEVLATYYLILASHFHIDGNTMPNQVIFREHSLPGPELDTKNFDNNISQKKARFKYGGQIYGYDNQLIENLVQKKIEKTETAEKILTALGKIKGTK